MKLGPDIYHVNIFGLPKNEGVNMWEGGGGVSGTYKERPENATRITIS